MSIDLNDKTANGNTLTNVNTVTEVTTNLPFAASTVAADFERDSSQKFTAVDSASLSITGNITIECWVKFESIGSGGYVGIVAKGTNDGTESYLLAQQENAGDDKLSLFISTDGTAVDILQVTWNPSTATWYHVAVTWTAASSTAKFYVDGTQQGADQVGAKTSIGDFNTGLEIGGGAFGVQTFDGIIDDIRIWNVVRTVTQIADNRSLQLTGTETNLKAYYPFNTLTATGGFFNLL